MARASSTELHIGFTLETPGPHADVFVVSSFDGGRTFRAPIRVSTAAPGETLHRNPVVFALADGALYAAYERVLLDGTVEVRANRSLDHGATWLPADILIGTVAATKASSYIPAVAIGAYPGGVVLVTWTDGDFGYSSRSVDSGARPQGLPCTPLHRTDTVRRDS